jgi:hypothetical protein
MGAPKGNQFWMARSRHGRRPKFETAEMLEEACHDYFQWVEDNPLLESRPFAYEGNVDFQDVPKMRAMTIDGLILFLDIDESTWRAWRTHEDKDFSRIVHQTENAIRGQKFAGAAAGFLNANIIARDLGLRDSKEVDHKSSDGSMSPADAPLSKKEAQELLDANK